MPGVVNTGRASVHECSRASGSLAAKGHPTLPPVASKERASKHLEERERREEHDSRDRSRAAHIQEPS
jgi:hypothetical protein